LSKAGKKLLMRLIPTVPVARFDAMLANTGLRSVLPQFGDKLQKLNSILSYDRPEAVYEQLITYWPDASALFLVDDMKIDSLNGFSGDQNFAEWMGWTDLHTYLPDDILVKLDRASMAVSLEARVPLLDDHQVVEFAFQLPYSMKSREGESKWLLRRVLDRYLPTTLFDRPKMGFGVPIDAWLRGPLREWAEELLKPGKLQQSGLRSEPIRLKWSEHVDGVRNWQYPLWNALMFQAWFAQN
jgi:asparagine synthase (glutamine-hydrolysing)